MASQTMEAACVLIVTLFSAVYSFMDIEELQSINYGINIVKEPIVIPETYPDTAILVTSRHGQQYQCSYPTHQEQKQQKEEEEKIALEMGVLELLKPLATQPCIIKTKDWWTYEICYGKHIRQYHIEDGQIRGLVMYLGHFHSDFDWNNETLRDSRVRSKIASGRYHSQYYTNGSKCDLTGKGRETEVRYLCEDTEDDYIVRVDEPETCVYVITVHTPRICRHPHLKSPTPTQPIPIVCAPLLTGQQFSQYQAHMDALRKKEEAAMAKAKAELEERERARAEAKAQEEDKNIEGGLTDSVNSILKKSLGKEMKNVDSASHGSSSEARDSVVMGWKVVRDLEDIDKLLVPQGIFGSMDMSHREESGEKPAKPAPKVDEQQSSSDKPEDVVDKTEIQEDVPQHSKPVSKHDADDGGGDDNKDLDSAIDTVIESELKEFDSEVKHLRDRQAMTQKRIEQIRDKVKKAVTSQFKDIIDEAEAEVGGEVDEGVAFKQLASSLNVLLEKLEHTEKEMKSMDQELSKLGEKEQSSATAATKGEEEKGTKEKDEGEVEEVMAEEEEEEQGEKKKEEEGEGLDGQKEKGGIQAPPSSRQGVKVQVKIIGASSDPDSDTTLAVLSDEDSENFQNMIVALLGGSNEALKERKRHDTLEEGYSFVFDQALSHDANNQHQSDSTSLPPDSEHKSSDKEEDKEASPVPDMLEKEL